MGAVGKIVKMDDSMDFMKLSLCVSPEKDATDLLTPPTHRPAVPEGHPIAGAKEEEEEEGEGEGREKFRSLLLFIPLRLGQDTFNTVYSEALKVRWQFELFCDLDWTHMNDGTCVCDHVWEQLWRQVVFTERSQIIQFLKRGGLLNAADHKHRIHCTKHCT